MEFVKNRKSACITSLAFGVIATALLVSGLAWYLQGESQPREAPEAERVLAAQVEMPFQVLVPAYLPRRFDRQRMTIETGLAGPAGEPMVRLIYSTRQGNALSLSEWLPDERIAGAAESGVRLVRCGCQGGAQAECDMRDIEVRAGELAVTIQTSAPGMITMQELQSILQTLGPAANLQVYASMQDIPVTYSLPPAQEIAANAQGVQEVILIVTPEGYHPAHFAVKKGAPVRLVFRRLGQVGCGSELLFTWGDGQETYLSLPAQNDQQVLEFTPQQAGVFQFNCPHLIYRGAMTVRE